MVWCLVEISIEFLVDKIFMEETYVYNVVNPNTP